MRCYQAKRAGVSRWQGKKGISIMLHHPVVPKHHLQSEVAYHYDQAAISHLVRDRNFLNIFSGIVTHLFSPRQGPIPIPLSTQCSVLLVPYSPTSWQNSHEKDFPCEIFPHYSRLMLPLSFLLAISN